MPCAAAPNAAATEVDNSPSAMKLPDAEPSAAAPYPSRAPRTNARHASTTFVSTVVGSVMPPHRGSDVSESVVIGLDVLAQNRTEERNMVSVPLALESLVRVIPPLEPQELGELGIGLQQLRPRAERVIREEPA